MDYSNNPIGNVNNFPPNLLFLQMSGTQTTALNNLPDLIRLNCSNNNITALISLPSTLQFLFAASNPALNQLPSSLPAGLTIMDIRHCGFQSIPPFPGSLQKVFVQNNQLNCIPFLPSGLQILLASGNNVFCLPNLLAPSFVTDLPLISCSAYNPNNCPSAGLIQGRIYYDQNANAIKDSGEPFLPNAMLSNGNGYFSVSNDSGYYQATPPPGMNTFCSNLPYQTNNNCVPVNTPPGFNNITVDFPVELLPSQNDLTVQAINCVSPRPYHEMDLKVIVKNKGSMESNSTTLKIVPDNFLSISSANFPFVAVGDTLVFDLDTLQIGGQQQLCLWFDVSISAPLGYMIEVPIWIQNNLYDVLPSDNYFLFSSEVVNSFDPNDKRVFPDGLVEEEFVTNQDSLTYTIRFQNTGTAPAIHIFITDTLSPLLNPSSFRFIGSSHTCSSVLENQLLTFYFNDIHLPDSTYDEPNSHGFVRFSIKFIPTAALLDTVRNKADIFFDYNAPVLTNHTLNFVSKHEFPTSTEMEKMEEFSIYPVPANKEFNFNQTASLSFKNFSIFTLEGQLILKGNVREANTKVDVSDLPAGAYYFRMSDGMNHSVTRKLVLIH